jgi:adenylylsulfate kinase
VTGAIVWLTGISGSGKTALADGVAARIGSARPLEILDGDAVRKELSSGLGFSRDDRNTNVRRIGFVARLLARHGVLVLVATISPYAETRDEMRRLSDDAGIVFLEIFVDRPLASAIARDVKGLYKRAIAGDIPHFTGISDPYEAPLRPELTLKTDEEPLAASLERLMALLESKGLVYSVAAQSP